MNEPMNQGGGQPMGGNNQEWPQDNSSPQTPFENTTPTAPTVGTPPPMTDDNQPLVMESPQSSGSLWILVGILAILLIAGGLVLASWQGWISLGGIEKLWGGGQTTTTNSTNTNNNTNTATPKVNANDTKRKSDLAKIKAALLKYYNEKQTYPVAEGQIKTIDPSNILTTTLVPNYLSVMPADPVASKYYGYESDGKSFELNAVLEDKTDPAGIMVGTIFLYKVTDTSTESTAGSSNTTTNNSTGGTTNNSATDGSTDSIYQNDVVPLNEF